jgi:hypothetical protein
MAGYCPMWPVEAKCRLGANARDFRGQSTISQLNWDSAYQAQRMLHLHRVVANCGVIAEKHAGRRLRPPVRIGHEEGERFHSSKAYDTKLGTPLPLQWRNQVAEHAERSRGSFR